jgi:hypothetical protein
MNYKPAPFPLKAEDVPAYLDRELRKISAVLSDQIFYRTLPANQGSLTAGISANWKIADGNVVRVSTSNTITIGALVLSGDWLREVVLINVGTGVLVLKSEDTGSSASYRFALPAALFNLSQNAAVTLWLDPYSARLRPISRTTAL